MKIAFCKFAGLANGGTEKYLQNIAMLFRLHHQVDYYYTNAAPIANTNWIHPDNSPDRIKLLNEHHISTIPIHVDQKIEGQWHNSNFHTVFDESAYDLLVTAGDGRPEYPGISVNRIPIIHTVHGTHVHNKHNIKKSVLISKWQADNWIKNGGDTSKLEIIPPIVHIPKTFPTSFRAKFNIPSEAIVYGLHQANGVGSLTSLIAFQHSSTTNDYYVILGGSDIHRSYVASNNIRNVIFIPHTTSTDTIHEFLHGIDVYAHCRNDGEVCSASIIEAMAHGKPVITNHGDGPNQGHIEQVQGCGITTHSTDEYTKAMLLIKDHNYRFDLSQKTISKYKSHYDYELVKHKLLQLVIT